MSADAGNPLGASPAGGQGPPPAAAKPDPRREEPGLTPPEPPLNGSASTPVGVPQEVTDAVVRVAASVDGLATEIELLRKRQRGIERQVIMVFGVLALILWKAGSAKAKTFLPEPAPLGEAVSDAVS